ncbi:hypothetical protein PS862_03640 [Pseudomonas fluorescens]|uniref:DUF3300 domain-containing protein n=1 Tax=Pseudomonas fluorescens TaxID=294 RepID=A0A5E7LYJ0_PSEFL|nr:DUF3300 domain-containing protein [Pseudomonas fluorescens]VVP16765.1 hypothetical protein PS862_03640 [Pseudomonas fluorescens]
MRVCHCFSAFLLAVLSLSGGSDEDPFFTSKAFAAAPEAGVAGAAPAPEPTAPAETVFAPEELDQMLAPLALYPDSLLAQVLMAATYPGDVADAVAWSRAHPDSSGDAAVRQVANEPWDPSVQSLVAFPAVLVMLGQDPAWVQRVGDAFLAQPNAVMDSVQRLRRQAQAAGHLQSNEQQRVTVQPAAPAPAASTVVVQQPAATQTIIIEPTQPQTVYVPSYNPSVVYGTWAYPSYPPVYYPPPPGAYLGSALAAGLAFGAGVAIVDSLWGDCDWGRGDIDIDVNRYNNINTNRQINANQNNWHHNSINRDGVPYRDRANREQSGQRLAGSEQRDAFRGRDPVRALERERASQSLAQRGIEPAATSNRQARERAQAASRDLGKESQLRERPPASAQTRHNTQANAPQREQAQASAQARQKSQAAAQKRQSAPDNPKVRQQARQQQARTQGPRNNAFAGASNPSQSRMQANRGQASHVSASRPSIERGSGHTVQRPSRGGGHRR